MGTIKGTLTEEFLLEKLKILFPGEEIQVNARKNTNLKYLATNSYAQVDIWMPKYELCFEFQDAYHYVSTWFYQYPRDKIRQKDTIKETLVRQTSASIIIVPCWWDGNVEWLAGTIKFARPDVLTDFGDNNHNGHNNNSNGDVPLIPLNPTNEYFAYGDIPHIGELMLASFPADTNLNKDLFINNWWMGEKYDGIRLCWNVTTKKIYTRSGNEILVLPSLIRRLPPIFLDGEFWFGRGCFNVTYALFHGTLEMVQWHFLRMILFDVPSLAMRGKEFEARYKILFANIRRNHPFATVASRMLCKNTIHLRKLTEAVIDEGGEGVILRQVKSLYIPGRSPYLIKLKTTFADAEAIVSAKGSDNSVTLTLPNGISFTVPEENIHIPTPRAGEIVTFSYERNNQRDIPLHPVIFRVRHDLLWRDVVHSVQKQKKFLNESSRAVSLQVHPLDYWNTTRMRVYLENFALSKYLDFLNASTWYDFAYEAIHQFQTGKLILAKFGGSYYKMLQHIFPEIHFDKNAFPEIAARRAFFENYAKRHSFSHTNPEKWYHQSKKRIMATEGARRVMLLHNNSIKQALLDLFPNIGLDKNKFPKPPMWHKVENRRKFFEEYAKENGFDPHNPNNWYSQSRKTIEAKKGASRILEYHKRSVTQALLDLFPDIGLVEAKFAKPVKWYSKETTKLFFARYAEEQCFDPRVPANWYLHCKDILAVMKKNKVNFYNNMSIPKTLQSLYPDIGLVESQFPPHQKYTTKSRNPPKRQITIEAV